MNIFTELNRRNVFRVAATYLLVSWLLLQVSDVLFDALQLPGWAIKLVVGLLAVGALPVLLFSWVYELTPEGIKKEAEISKVQSVATTTGRKLNLVIVILLLLAVGLLAYRQFAPQRLLVTASGETRFSGLQPEIAPADQSIAVLPFANLSQDPANEPFTLGIQDDLLTRLSKIHALRVISRTSVLRYRNSDKPIAQIARELGVANVLEGGVQRAGKRLRINVQLIDAVRDEHLWAETYDRSLTADNIFAIQSEISTAIAKALQATLSPQEKSRIAAVPTANLEAYSEYQLGRQAMLSRSSKSLAAALKHFVRAAALDPDYALAYVGQTDTIALLQEYGGMPMAESQARRKPLLDRALALDPDSGEAHTSLADYLRISGDFAAAEREYKRALELNPNYATTYHWYGLLLRNSLGQPERALELFRKAALLNPLSPVIRLNVGRSLAAMGRYDEALAQYRKIIELDPKYPGAPEAMAGLYAGVYGRLDEAIRWQRRGLKLDPGNVAQRAILGYYYLDIGLPSAADEALEQAGKRSPEYAAVGFLASDIALYRGDFAQALNIATAMAGQAPQKRWMDQLIYLNALSGHFDVSRKLAESTYPALAASPPEVNLTNALSAINLARALRHLHHEDRAGLLLTRACKELAAIPRDRDPLNLLAYCLVLQGDYHGVTRALLEAGEKHSVSGWWRTTHDPAFALWLATSEGQSRWKDLQVNLAVQRKQLAESTDE